MLREEFITAVLGLEDFYAMEGELKEDGSIELEVELRWDVALCVKCHHACGSVVEYRPRRMRDLSISGRAVYVRFEQRRFRCPRCGISFLERLQSSDSPGVHYTKRYEEWVARQVNQSTVEAVAEQEGLSWDGVQYILVRVAVRKGLLKSPAVVRWVAFDEIALKKRHKQYVLVISAPELGRVLAVLPQRTKAVLKKWLEDTWTDAQRRQVEVVSIDMWDGYFHAALESLPAALIVIDRFHVQKNLLEAITKLRRQIQKQLSEKQRQALKGMRWLIVRNYDELDTADRKKLDRALDRCPELALCHAMKEDFRDWYEEEEHDVETAHQALESWKEQAKRLGSQAMNNFVQTVENWQEWILNYFVERASNGFAEGLNGALQRLKNKAYGFRNVDNFRLRALLLHAFS